MHSLHSQGWFWFYKEVWEHMKVEIDFVKIFDWCGPRGWVWIYRPVMTCGDIWRFKMIFHFKICWMKVAQEVAFDVIDLTSQHTIHSKISSLYLLFLIKLSIKWNINPPDLTTHHHLLLLHILSIESTVRTSIKSGNAARPLYGIKCLHPFWKNKMDFFGPHLRGFSDRKLSTKCEGHFWALAPKF